MESINQRKEYLDSIRFIAVFMVFLTHFINRFGEPYKHYFHDFPTAIVLYGISGKMGVAILAVIMGMLAYKTKHRVEEALVHRYVFFLISGFVINCGYVIWNFFSVGENIDIIELLHATFLLKDTYFPALWFIRDFFFAYVISILNCKANIKVGGVFLEIIILVMFSEIWIAVCLIGNIVAEIEALPQISGLSNHTWIPFLLLVIAWLITKMPVETNITFISYGISCALILVSIFYSKRVRRIFSMKWLAFLGKYSWGFFLVHALVYNWMTTYFFHLEKYSTQEGYWKWFIACFLCCTLCNIVLSLPVSKGIVWLTGKGDIVTKQIFVSGYERVRVLMHNAYSDK